MSELINFLLAISAKMGYGGVFFLMSIESSFIPFPSEIVIPPAAYLASQGEMNLYLIIFFGTLGALFGASLNYVLALTLGRKIIYRLAKHRYARFFLIDEDKIKNSEQYFVKYGNVSTFFGRLLPAIRQLISIPAGFSKMPFCNFIFFTFLGSFFWSLILAYLGYFFGANQDLLKKYYKEISYFFIVFCLLVFASIYLWKKKKKIKL